MTVAILGVGLIGGSVGLALRARQPGCRVIGIGRNAETLAEARRLGAIDEATTDLAEGVAHADVAVIGTPVNRIAADALAAAEFGPERLLVTDVGSTKNGLVRSIEASPRGRSTFVGAHPIAGSDRSGVAHARPDLFDGRVCVLTPTDRTPADRLDRAKAFWEGLGCRLVVMAPDTHDECLAYTSHLPHAVAAALAATVPADLLPLAAGAYRDGTRVANSDAELWSAIFLENRRYVLEALDVYAERLENFRQALEVGQADRLRELWRSARSQRGAFDATESAAFGR